MANNRPRERMDEVTTSIWLPDTPAQAPSLGRTLAEGIFRQMFRGIPHAARLRRSFSATVLPNERQSAFQFGAEVGICGCDLNRLPGGFST